MEYIIKELEETDDYKQYCKLLKQLTKINLEEIDHQSFNQQLAIIKSNPYHKIIIVKDHDQIIGTTTVFIEPKFIHNLSRVAHIEDVVVSNNYRGHGIGRLLINHAVQIAKNHNCYKIILDCADDVVNFYQKLGFIKKENQMALYFE